MNDPQAQFGTLPLCPAAAGTIDLPPGTKVKLTPGGSRVRPGRLVRPLKLGDRVNRVLTVEASDRIRQEIPADAEVRRYSPTGDHRHPHRH
jgi:copper(I)-binding protein